MIFNESMFKLAKWTEKWTNSKIYRITFISWTFSQTSFCFILQQ